ncbi:NADH-flavin oxidoreductase/NADH oxidase [Xylogone sp. PMI_703]|nr:NADH-flavin oxidoreductase/NADH oxidase [Xylogone sp. PMI_703]
MGSIETPSTSKLFTPLKIGDMMLSHRVIMGPLTRARSPAGIPTPLVAEMYAQRATPGGLIISEGVLPSVMGGNMFNVPGIYTPEQVRAWRVVTDAVHAKGGYIFCQLWHVGRFAVSMMMGGRQPISSSATNIGSINILTPKGPMPHETSREMTLKDIAETIEDHVHAAKCAIEAGFDGVELSSANGYLFDQFINSQVNLRTDHYGGCNENRCRLTLETLDAMAAAIGPSRVAVRLSPWGTVWVPLNYDPISLFTYLTSEVDKRGLAYVCMTQPQADLLLDESTKWDNLRKAVAEGRINVTLDRINLRPFEDALKNTPRLASGNYDGQNCFEEVEKGELDAITFGRWFISNPDLVERIRSGKKLAGWDQKTWYSTGPEGYTDYPNAV